ncbi:MAG: hypothetical protein U5L08_02070 [Xanthomonadales bacterium]|nr:hypothetical protein [Xanthomonadales bacterium]
MPDAPEDRNRRVEDYVRGNADDETARQLEIEMLEDDDLFERVQTEDLLKRGFQETERVAFDQGRGDKPSAHAPRLPWALAASFGAAAVLLGVYSLQLNDRLASLQSPSIGLPVITLLEQRSLLPEPAEPAANLAAHQGPVFLEIDVSGYEYPSFQLELVREQGSLIWEKQIPDERGYLNVLVPQAQSLKAIVLRSSEDEVLKTYSF